MKTALQEGLDLTFWANAHEEGMQDNLGQSRSLHLLVRVHKVPLTYPVRIERRKRPQRTQRMRGLPLQHGHVLLLACRHIMVDGLRHSRAAAWLQGCRHPYFESIIGFPRLDLKEQTFPSECALNCVHYKDREWTAVWTWIRHLTKCRGSFIISNLQLKISCLT